MRISDWSSDVCSSDLITGRSPHILVFAKEHRDVLSRAGWDKRRIREYIAENTVISEEAFRRAGGEASGPMRLIEDPDQLLIVAAGGHAGRSEEHTSELQSLMRISYAVFCLKNKK